MVWFSFVVGGVFGGTKGVILFAYLSLVLLATYNRGSGLGLTVTTTGGRYPVSVKTSNRVSDVAFSKTSIMCMLLVGRDFLGVSTLGRGPSTVGSTIAIVFNGPRKSVGRVLSLIINASSNVGFVCGKGASNGRIRYCLAARSLGSVLGNNSATRDDSGGGLRRRIGVAGMSYPVRISRTAVLGGLAVRSSGILCRCAVSRSMMRVSTLGRGTRRVGTGIGGSLGSSSPTLHVFLRMYIGYSGKINCLCGKGGSKRAFRVSFKISRVGTLLWVGR